MPACLLRLDLPPAEEEGGVRTAGSDDSVSDSEEGTAAEDVRRSAEAGSCAGAEAGAGTGAPTAAAAAAAKRLLTGLRGAALSDDPGCVAEMVATAASLLPFTTDERRAGGACGALADRREAALRLPARDATGLAILLPLSPIGRLKTSLTLPLPSSMISSSSGDICNADDEKACKAHG